MKTLYLDMDGVLVDFVKGALKVHDRTLPFEEVTWDFNEKLGIPAKEFYYPMGRMFWAGLEWTVEGQRLLEELEHRFGDNIILLTAPVDTPGCEEGKKEWVKNNIPHFKRRVFVGTDKFHLAGPNKVLVDDNEKNVTKFYEHGGKSVLVPRPWNIRSKETEKGIFNIPDLLRVIEVQMA